MLFKSMLVSALVATSSAAVIARTGGGDSPSTPTNPTPESCTTRDDGNTSPKYCPNLGGIGVVIPVQLCSLGMYLPLDSWAVLIG